MRTFKGIIFKPIRDMSTSVFSYSDMFELSGAKLLLPKLMNKRIYVKINIF